MLFVTGSLCERGGRLLRGRHVLLEYPISSVDMCEKWIAATGIGYIVAVVTGNLCERGGGHMLGGRVLYKCLLSRAGKYEGRTDASRRPSDGGSLVGDPMGSVSVIGCFVEGLVRADQSCLNVDESAAKSLLEV